jgi:uncharacterized protein (TIGR03000 family)
MARAQQIFTKEVALMKRQFWLLALPALALACMLCVTEPSYAQRRGGGRGYSGGRGYYGGYGNGYGGYGNGYGGYYGGYGNGYGGYGLGGYGYGGGLLGGGLLGVGYGRGYGGYGGYGYGSGYGYSPYNSYGSGYYGSGYATPGLGYSGGVNTIGYQSLYPPTGGPGQGTTANIYVHVPATAQVLFDGTPTVQTGTDRVFTTGSLDPTKHYAYQITATWTENGNQRREVREARIIPGQATTVDFMSPAPPQQLQQQPKTSTDIR